MATRRSPNTKAGHLRSSAVMNTTPMEARGDTENRAGVHEPFECTIE